MKINAKAPKITIKNQNIMDMIMKIATVGNSN